MFAFPSRITITAVLLLVTVRDSLMVPLDQACNQSVPHVDSVANVENCPNITLTQLPTTNFHLHVFNSTIYRLDFPAFGTLALVNISMVIVNSTVLSGIYLGELNGFVRLTLSNVSIEFRGCKLLFPGTSSKFILFVDRPDENYGIVNLNVTLSHCDVDIAFLSPVVEGLEINAYGILSVRMLQANSGALAGIHIVVRSCHIVMTFPGVSNVSHPGEYYVDARVVSLDGGGRQVDNTTGITKPPPLLLNSSITIENCILESAASSDNSMLLVLNFNISAFDVRIVGCNVTMVTAGTITQAIQRRRSSIVMMVDGVVASGRSSFTVVRTGLSCSTVAGDMSVLPQASSVKSVTAALVAMSLDHTTVLIAESAVDMVVSSGQFSSHSGQITACLLYAFAENDSRSSYRIEVAQSRVSAVVVPILCFHNRVVKVGPLLLNISSGALIFTFTHVLVTTWTSQLSVSVRSSTLSTSFSNISTCPNLDSVAFVSGVFPNLPVTSVLMASVSSVGIMNNQHAINEVGSVLFHDNPFLVGYGQSVVPASSGLVHDVNVTIHNTSIVCDLSRYLYSVQVSPLEQRALLSLYAANVTSGAFSVAPLQDSTPFVASDRGSLKVCTFLLVGKDWLQIGNDGKGAISGVNFISFLNTLLVQTEVYVWWNHTVNCGNSSSGSLITFVNSSIQEETAIVLEYVAAIANAEVGMAIASAMRTEFDHASLNISCAIWNGVLFVDGATGGTAKNLLQGLPSSVVHFQDSSQSGCAPIHPLQVVRGSHRGTSVSALVVISFIASSMGRSGGVRLPAALVASLGMTFPTSCDTISFTGAADGNYLSLSVGNSDDAASPVRGTIIGSVIVGGVITAAAFASALVFSFVREVPVASGVTNVRFPGCLYGAVPWVLMPLLSATVALSSRGPLLTAADTILLIVGYAGGCLVVAGGLFERLCLHFQAVARPYTNRVASTPRSSPKGSGWLLRLQRAALPWISRCTSPLSIWENAGRNGHFVERFGLVFEDLRAGRQWYAVVDVSMTLLLSTAQGVGFQAASHCETIGGVFGCIELAQVIALAVLQPMQTVHDKIVAALVSVLPVVNAVMLIVVALGGCNAQRCGDVAVAAADAQLFLSLALLLLSISVQVASVAMCVTGLPSSSIFIAIFRKWILAHREGAIAHAAGSAGRQHVLWKDSGNGSTLKGLSASRAQVDTLRKLIGLICEQKAKEASAL